MELIEEHVSPDGHLKLLVQRDGTDVTLGFDPFAWSTSAGFLASKWGVTPQAAVRHFVSELIGNRAIIAVAYVGEAVRDVWITDRPSAELKYRRHEEKIAFRFWDGTAWSVDRSEGSEWEPEKPFAPSRSA